VEKIWRENNGGKKRRQNGGKRPWRTCGDEDMAGREFVRAMTGNDEDNEFFPTLPPDAAHISCY